MRSKFLAKNTVEVPGSNVYGIITICEKLGKVVMRSSQKKRFDQMFSGGWTWQGFCRDLDPCWFEYRI